MSNRHRERAAGPGRIAVALHDIEPATFERCALIRDWLNDHGVDRVTLLVIPARDLHPLGERSPEMVQWLRERELGGDAIAQHGFHHQRAHRTSGPRALLADLRATGVRTGAGGAEFLGLDATETRRAVESGRRVLKLAGIEPQGFVAPSYAYTPALRVVVSARFRWWAELLHLRRSPADARTPAADPLTSAGDPDGLLFPPIAIGGAGPLRSAIAPTLVRAGAMLAGPLLRLDVHPADLERTRHMLALEWVLKRAHARVAVTYDELAGIGSHAPPPTFPGAGRLAA